MIDIDQELAQAEADLRRALLDPARAQHELLRDILAVNRDTEYGRAYDFGSIGDLATYRARVPILSYGTVAPYVDRMVEGESDVLFAGTATFFGCTSGTTAAPKRIAFNPRVRAEYVHMLGPMVTCLDRDHPGASRHWMLLTAQYDESRSPTGVPIGNASGFARRCLDEHPFFRLVPEAVYESRDPDVRSYLLLLFALMRPMRGFASLFPVLLTNLFKRANEHGLALADDLERGRLDAGPIKTRELLADCAPRLRPMPDAARRLRDILRTHGRFVPAEYWPDVVALNVWKGGTAKHALGELQAIFPRAEIRPFSSGSTEASLMVPLERSWIGGVPALRSTVMEFLPVDGTETVALHELEPDRGYRLVVTNHRGLYRYLMEDVFLIETIYEGVPVLRLDHRVGIVSSFAGEKVTELQIVLAIERASAATGFRPGVFQVAPERVGGDRASFRYAVQLELDGEVATPLLREFLAEIETDLYERNSQYALNRNLGALGAAVLYRMRPGYFDGVLRARPAQGRNDIQFKLIALDTQLRVEDATAILETVEL